MYNHVSSLKNLTYFIAQESVNGIVNTFLQMHLENRSNNLREIKNMRFVHISIQLFSNSNNCWYLETRAHWQYRSFQYNGISVH